MTSLYAALSQCSQAIVHCSGADELFPRICRAAVEFGGMKMAWVGLIDEATQMLRPTAAFGSGMEYLEGIEISRSPDEVTGKGPCGITMRENRPYWCQDYLNDPLLAPWHERGVRSGWGSMAALPLHHKGKIVGAFSLYVGEVNAFDEATCGLLKEMVMEVDYALDAYDLQAQRKQDVQALEDSEKQFRSLFELANDGIFLLDLEGNLIDINRVAHERLGYSKEEMLAMHIRAVDAPEAAAKVSARMAQIKQHGQTQFESIHQRKDGTPVPVDVSSRVIDLKGEKVVLSIIRDISERKKAEVEMRQNEEQLRHVISGASLGYWDWNFKTGAHDVNDRWLEMLGLDRSEISNDIGDWEARINPEDKQRIQPVIEASFTSGEPYTVEFRMKHKDGHWVWIQGSGAVIAYDPVLHEPLRICGTHQDVSERKQAEEKLLLTQFVSDHAPAGICWVDEQARICYANDTSCGDHGHTREEMLGMSISDIDPDFPMDAWPAHWQELTQAGSLNFETRHCRKDGTIFPVEVSTNFVRFGDKEYNIAYVRDITERKKEERNTARLFQAVQQAGEAVLMTDRNGTIEYVNPAFTTMTGYSVEDALGKTPAMLKSEAQDPAFYKDLWDTITRGDVWHGTLIDRKKDGSFYPALMSVAPIHADNGDITHFVALQQDMSEYKRLEGQFLQAQKMEAIGTLVGGIAHDFNNMLAAIQGNVYLSKMKLKGQPEVADKLDSIESLGMRAADMVKQLLTFARKGRVEMVGFSLNAFIKDAFKLARAAIPENIELVCDLCPEELVVQGDATQMQQVLMNLLNNARDAVSHVSDPGVSCSLRSFAASDTFIKAHPDIKGDRFALLMIRDNGVGIPKELVNKVFEPFFTTKGVGEGTGLGLAMVYGAVQSHGGIIEVESEPGTGTSFSIYLPLVKKAGGIETASAASVIQGLGETILLVDDEESMRETTGEVLESLGYKLLKAGDGEESLEIFKAHRLEIALIITDIVMPKVGGIELAKSIRQLDMDVPIIFATGYDKESTIPVQDQIEQSTVINKPFSYQKLSRLMRQMLDTD